MLETAKNPIEKVRQLQRRLWVCAKQSRTRRFHALYDRIYRSDVLWEAWMDTESRREAAATGDTDGTGPGDPNGGEVSDRADFRGGLPAV